MSEPDKQEELIPYFLALDTEHGGFGGPTTLLSVYFEVLSEDLRTIASLEMSLRPNDKIYQVNAEALAVNGIDLVKHDQQAISYSSAGQILRDFLKQHSRSGARKLIPLGHNVHDDVRRVYDDLLGKGEATKYVSYRMLDTGTVGQFLKQAGRIPKYVAGSLGSYVEHYHVEEDGFHTAKGDTKMTIEVMRAMLNELKGASFPGDN